MAAQTNEYVSVLNVRYITFRLVLTIYPYLRLRD